MNIWLTRIGSIEQPCLVPGDEDALQVVRRLGAGELILATVVRPRSVKWRRLYYGMCREIGKNQDPRRDEHSIDNELRILAGHFDVMHIVGHEVRVPKRIAFHKMSADEWAELFPSLDLAARERFGFGADDLRSAA